MNSKVVGRESELEVLAELFNKGSASLVTVTGRRRIGKSRLIQEFAKGHRFLQFSGLAPDATTTHESELREFAIQLSRQTGLPGFYVDDWSKLFFFLAKEVATGRVIILFDEISWMGSKDSQFLAKLKIAWDLAFTENAELILILCSSVSMWIDKNILSSTAFLGRVTMRLTVDELHLADCNQQFLD